MEYLENILREKHSTLQFSSNITNSSVEKNCEELTKFVFTKCLSFRFGKKKNFKKKRGFYELLSKYFKSWC